MEVEIYKIRWKIEFWTMKFYVAIFEWFFIDFEVILVPLGPPKWRQKLIKNASCSLWWPSGSPLGRLGVIFGLFLTFWDAIWCNFSMFCDGCGPQKVAFRRGETLVFAFWALRGRGRRNTAKIVLPPLKLSIDKWFYWSILDWLSQVFEGKTLLPRGERLFFILGVALRRSQKCS